MSKKNKTQEPKVTSEKPVKIPLDFKKALEVLLSIRPIKDKKGQNKKTRKTNK